MLDLNGLGRACIQVVNNMRASEKTAWKKLEKRGFFMCDSSPFEIQETLLRVARKPVSVSNPFAALGEFLRTDAALRSPGTQVCKCAYLGA